MNIARASIVVLDGYCLNPGDLSWERLEALGDCTIYDRTQPEEIVERSSGADILLTNKVTLRRDVLESLSRLKYIGVSATGYNIIDVEAARELGIVVTNVPSYGTASVAQMVFAHLLNLTQRVADHAQAVRRGRWAESPDWCFWEYPLLELNEMTMAIVGFGRIGQEVARMAGAFGMQVMAHTRSSGQSTSDVRFVDLETVFRASDVLTLHCPLTPETQRLVNEERLAIMKPSALLINTSRGQLVDELALADALNNGRLAGAGLDVLEHEPPSPNNPLYMARNCFITPHIAWATRASRKRLLDAATENVAHFLRGKPRHVVNF
jgi:glycerate dehydrogenase